MSNRDLTINNITFWVVDFGMREKVSPFIVFGISTEYVPRLYISTPTALTSAKRATPLTKTDVRSTDIKQT